jgi:hypothetical protein
MKLRQALQSCPTGLLRKIAATSGLPVETTTLRTELVDGLTDRLTRAARERALWRALDADERMAVALVEGAGARHEAELLVRRLDARRATPDAGRSPPETLSRLVERGALFRVFETGAAAPGTYYALPDEYLGSIEPHPDAGFATLSVAADLAPNETRRNDPLHDCFVLASALRREGWNRGSRSLVGRTGPSVDRLFNALRPAVPDPARPRLPQRWRFFLELGRLGGWLDGGRWPMPVDERVRALFDNRSATMSSLWQAYLAGRAGAPRHAAGQAAEQDGRSDVATPRAVVQLLAELPTGVWFSIPGLKAGLLAELGIGSQSPDRQSQLDDWILGPWFWLGLIAVGRSADGWTLVATTPALRQLAGRGAERSIAETAPCELDPDLRLRAPPAADLAALYETERYLAYAGGDAPRRYALTAASFARGLRLGGSGGEAATLLERLARAPLPLAWRRALDGWEASAGDLRIDARLLLSGADPDSLDRAMRIGRVADAVGEVVSERHAWIVPERLADVLTALAEAGHPVTMDSGLWLESARPGAAAMMRGGAVELLWILLRAVRAVDRAALEQAGAWESVNAALDAVVPATSRPSLERRAEVLAERLKRTRGGRGRRPE